jgi:hypothetical protein
MSKSKNSKQKFLQSHTEKSLRTQNGDRSSLVSTDNFRVDENQVTQLTLWLDGLNAEQLIIITAQNDIVIMPGGTDDQAQQIFVNSDDVNAYMEAKMYRNKTIGTTEIVGMSDIARILLREGYVNGSAGQLSFSTQTILPDSDELRWLISIVHSARPDPKFQETHVKLFDGENMQSLRIPYEYMAPTDDPRTVATYLFRNGHVRYNTDTGTYAYRYTEPDILLSEKTKSLEHAGQRQLISFHIRQIYVDKRNERVELEFNQDPSRRLVLPARWYHHVLAHDFDRNYIIDILLANGGVIDRDEFVFMGHAYPLQVSSATEATSNFASSTSLRTVNLSSKEKNDLIRRYIDLIIEHDGSKQDDISGLLLLKNTTDGRKLYFTSEHSDLIRQNQFQRQDVIHLLVKHGQIKQDEFGNLILHYNNQYIQLPPSLIPSSTVVSQNTSNGIRSLAERFFLGTVQVSRPTTVTSRNVEAQAEPQPGSASWYYNTIDYMYRHGLVTWDKRLKLIKLQFSDQTLLIPINHLRSIVDPHVLASASTTEGVLPFSSRQLSQWLLNNSYMMRNNR